MAARADVAIVAIRRPTGTFSGTGFGSAGGAEDGESAVGASVIAGAAAGAAEGDPALGCAAYGQPACAGGAAGSADAAGGFGCDPLCQVRARITRVGESWTFSGRLALVSRSSNCRALGRLCGSLANEASTSGRSESGTEAMSASPYMIRYRTEWVFPAPNGDRPVAAYATVTPQAKMSASGPGCPLICSGAMKPIEPIIMPVLVTAVVSSRRAMPKSMTFGPASVRMMLEGLRSRCMMPAAWIVVRASASPVASPNSMSGATDPCLSMYSDSDGPGAYSVTTNGVADRESASITRTVQTPLT